MTSLHRELHDDFDRVRRAELADISKRRCIVRGFAEPSEPAGSAGDCIGMALSGGSVRAASFHLGVIQAFQKSDFFRLIDYLSTVGGGSYLGGHIVSQYMNDFAADRYREDIADSGPRIHQAMGKVSPEKFNSTKQQESGGQEWIDPDFPIQAEGYGTQSLAIRRLLGGDVIGPIAFLDNYAIGLIVNNLVFISGLIAFCSFVVFSWKSLDSMLRGWLETNISWPTSSPGSIPLLPFFFFFACWILAWVYSFFRHGAAANGSITTRKLFTLVVASGMIGGVVGMGSDIVVEGMDWTAPILRASTVAIIVITFLGLLPFLAPKQLLLAGEAPRTTVAGLVFFTASRALLIGLPLVVIYLLGRVFRTHELIWVFQLSSLVFFAAGLLVSFNATSSFGLTRQMLARQFVDKTPGSGNTIPLREADSCRAGGPYLLISGTVFLNDSATKTSSFLFSNCFCGSRQLGYIRTESFCDGRLDLAHAMAISGPSIATATGEKSPLMRFLRLVLNMEHGQWLPNPVLFGQRINATLFRLALNQMFAREQRSLVYVTDGGIHDNLGLEELLLRRCRLIFVSDAAMDPGYTFSDFAAICRRMRIDHGIRFLEVGSEKPLDFSLLGLDVENRTSELHFFAARVIFPPPLDGRKESYNGGEALLIYIKASLTGDEDVEIGNYRATHADFPHSSNRDYASNEAYRLLGFHIGSKLLAGFRSTDQTPSKLSTREAVAWFLRDDSPLHHRPEPVHHRPESSTVSQIEKSFNTSVNRLLYGPKLDKYNGYLCMQIERAQIGGTIVVWLQHTAPETECYEKLEVGGQDAQLVEFEIRLDCDGGRISPPKSHMTAFAERQSEEKRFVFVPESDRTTVEIWVEAYQKNRRVLVAPFKVDVTNKSELRLIAPDSETETIR